MTWRNLLRLCRPVVRPSRSVDRASRRLNLELLEDRLAPATFTVVSTSDGDDGLAANLGTMSLRKAVRLANENDGADLIKFAPGITTVTLTEDQLSLNDDDRTTIDGGVTGVTIQRSSAAGTPRFRIFDVAFGPGTPKADFVRLTISGGNYFEEGAGIKTLDASVNVINCTITGNIAEGLGGGGIFNDLGVMTVTNSTISGNSADISGGGGIANRGTLTLVNSTISGNAASNEGGGISNDGMLTVTNSTLSGNSANNSGGGGISNRGTLTLVNSTLSGNTASNEGGGIFNDLGVMTVTNSTLSGNSTGSSGGAIFNGDSGLVTVTNSTIADNTAEASGGGLFNLGTLTIDHSVISWNIANGNEGNGGGGGVGNYLGMVTLMSTTVSQNSAVTGYGFGGGIENHSGTISLTNANLTGNSAKFGAGIYNSNNGTVTATNTTVSKNSATQDGGGVHNNVGRMTLANTTLSGNSALLGGGINNHATLTVTNSTLSGNSATDDGGGIYNTALALTVTNSTLVLNCADADGNGSGTGGGMYAVGTETLLNSIIAGNRRGAGAGIPDDINGGTINTANNNLIGDPASAGGLTHGTSGNVLGDGLGNLLPLGLVLDPVLRNNGGATLTHALLPGSPALNAGNNTLALDPGPDGLPGGGDDFPLTFDQRGPGYTRLVGANVDLGAFEMPLALFTDNFDRTNNANLGPNWLTKVGTPGINGNRAAGTSPVSLATVKNVTMTDADLVASVNLQNGQQAGLVARYAGAGNKNYYLATLAKDSLGNVVAKILVNVNGATTELVAVENAATGTGTVRFRVVGNALQLFLNGNLLASVTDSRFTKGQVGLVTTGATALDDFAVFPVATGIDRQDPFTQPDYTTLSEPWTQVQGFFRTLNNQLQGGQSNNLAVLNAGNAADVDLRLSVNIAGVNHQAGLVARQAGLNFYAGQLRRSATGFVAQIVRSVNGVNAVLATANVPSTTGKANLRLLVTGINLRLYVNDALVLDILNNTFKSGSVGIRSDAYATLDNFQAAVVATTLPFQDAFDTPTGLSTNWTRRVGAFSTTANRAVGSASVNLATLVGLSAADATVQAAVNLSAVGQQIGLLARYNGSADDSYYMGRVTKTATGVTLAIVKKVGATTTVLATVNVGNLTGAIKFQVSGTSLKLFMNGVQQLNASDSSLTTGGIGIRSTLGAGLDDFSASTP